MGSPYKTSSLLVVGQQLVLNRDPRVDPFQDKFGRPGPRGLQSHVALPEYRREDLEELLNPELAPEIMALAADASVVCWPLDSRWDAEEPMPVELNAEWVSVEKSGL
ncbi:hypothetical protein CRUP_029339 [Coryphaenoides rupestris]|nr:hypothetical protein CRUP_029339 [Coryphaenoides rupestris]